MYSAHAEKLNREIISLNDKKLKTKDFTTNKTPACQALNLHVVAKTVRQTVRRQSFLVPVFARSLKDHSEEFRKNIEEIPSSVQDSEILGT